MNQPSPSAAQATRFPKPPSRLFRYRSAVYSIVAISIAGAASAPQFVVQRTSAQDKQSRQQPLQSPGQPTQVALAVAQLADADPLAPVSQESITALTNRAQMPAAPVAQKRAQPIRHDVAGSAFKPLRVAAWLPDPASYVARNSDADGNAPLPAIAIERTPDLKPGPVARTSDKAVEPAAMRAQEQVAESRVAESRSEAVAAKPVLSEARRASLALQAIPRLQEMVSLTAPSPSASEPQVAVATRQAQDEAEATIVVAAARSDASHVVAAAAPDHLAFHLQVGDAPAAVSKVGGKAAKPVQASTTVDEEVVIVAAASASKLDAPIERVAAKAAKTANADMVVVSTAPAETVNLDAELRGLSLAMATRLNAPQSSLARGPELPNWAVMGEGKKLRVAR